MSSHTILLSSFLDDNFTLNDVPDISIEVTGIRDLNNPNFLLTIFSTHHDGAVIFISIPAGSPVSTLNQIEVVLVLFFVLSVALIIPTLTSTGSPLHIGIDIPFHMYSTLAATLRNVSMITTSSGVVSIRCRQL